MAIPIPVDVSNLILYQTTAQTGTIHAFDREIFKINDILQVAGWLWNITGISFLVSLLFGVVIVVIVVMTTFFLFGLSFKVVNRFNRSRPVGLSLVGQWSLFKPSIRYPIAPRSQIMSSSTPQYQMVEDDIPPSKKNSRLIVGFASFGRAASRLTRLIRR